MSLFMRIIYRLNDLKLYLEDNQEYIPSDNYKIIAELQSEIRLLVEKLNHE